MYQLKTIIRLVLILLWFTGGFYGEVWAQTDLQTLENQLKTAQQNGNQTQEHQLLQQLATQYERQNNTPSCRICSTDFRSGLSFFVPLAAKASTIQSIALDVRLSYTNITTQYQTIQ